MATRNPTPYPTTDPTTKTTVGQSPQTVRPYSYAAPTDKGTPGQDYDVMCEFCGKRHLHWQETPHGWRLFSDEHKLHNCKKPYRKRREE